MASGTVPVQLRIGTRGSPLALWQAREVQAQIAAARGWPLAAIEIVVIRTSGDMIQDRALSQAGGKGLFTKEIESALLERSVQIAVHSAKDMPTRFPDGIVIAGYLARADVRDALISARATSLDELPQGATVGTASLRRQALIKRQRPDIVTTLLRGNVETRLGKAESGEIDATLRRRPVCTGWGWRTVFRPISIPRPFRPPLDREPSRSPRYRTTKPRSGPSPPSPTGTPASRSRRNAPS